MILQLPTVMIYKRTHRGDPDKNGVFGIHDCMGKVRDRNYDAVIGIGGKCPWQGDENIAYKINWIGINPKKQNGTKRGSYVTFSKFCLYDEKGPLVKEIAPKLFKYMYIDAHRRVVMSYSMPNDLFDEILSILNLANSCLPSIGLNKKATHNRNCR